MDETKLHLIKSTLDTITSGSAIDDCGNRNDDSLYDMALELSSLMHLPESLRNKRLLQISERIHELQHLAMRARQLMD